MNNATAPAARRVADPIDDATLRLTLQRGRDTHTILRLPRGPVRIARTVALALLALGGVGIALHATLFALAKMYVFPYWDMASVQYLYFNLSWTDFLLFRDNEHLPFVAMPFFAADNLLFAGRGVSLVALLLLLTAVVAGLLTAEVKRCWGRVDLALAATAGVVVAVLFWLIHYDNLIWPKQIHMYLSAVFALLAARQAIALDEGLRWDEASVLPGPLPFVGLGLLLAAATFSFGYGMIGWVAVLILVATGRWPWRAAAVLLAIFGLTALVYALCYNYPTLEQHSNPVSSITHPLRLVWYAIHYLAHPVVALLNPVLEKNVALTVGLAVSIAGAAGSALFLVRVLLLRRRQASRTDLFVAFLLLFSVGTGLMTGLSRLGFGVEQALSSRYAIVQVWFWIGLGLMALAALRERVWLRNTLVAVVGLAVMALLVPSHFAYANTVRSLLRTHWQSVLAVVNGVDDEVMVRQNLHPRRDVFDNLVTNLAAHHFSVYADPQPGWLGQRADALFRIVPGARCLGNFDTASDLGRLQGQSYVEGWAWDVEGRRPPVWQVLVDEGGTVRGLARSGWNRSDVEAGAPQTRGTATGWRGYVAAPVPLPGVRAYAVLADGASICPLSRSQP